MTVIIGVKGETKTFKKGQENEFFDWLVEARKGILMWRNCVDVVALCNLIKTDIDIVVLDQGQSTVEKFSFKPDDKFKWDKEDRFKPNFEGERLNGKMTILNYKNTHFNLIITKKHALYQVGSLKFQQEKASCDKILFKKNVTFSENLVEDKRNKKTESESVVNTKKLTDPVIEEHIHCCREEDTCLEKKCENEIDVIKKELDKYKKALKEEVEKRCKAEDMLRALQTIQNIDGTEKLNEKSPPIHSKPKEDIALLSVNGCELCEVIFNTKSELDSHVLLTHKKNKCENCDKEYMTSMQIKRHIWRSHEPVDCNDCGKHLSNRHDLKRHKVDDHKVTKLQECKFFQEGHCVDGSECLFSHSNQGYVTQHNRQSRSKLENTKACNCCHMQFEN